MKLLDKNISYIKRLCTKYKVAKLYLFGSVLTDKFNESSDVDIVVEFKSMEHAEYVDNYYDFKSRLEKHLKRKVDLLEGQAIKNPFLKREIDSTKQLIYGQQNICLFDVKTVIEEIDSFFEEGERKYQNYLSDIRTKRAIERNIEIIGEAINRIIKLEETEIEITNARQIVNTRNRIIHGYDSVSDDMIWGIVINHIPKLKNEIDDILDKYTDV